MSQVELTLTAEHLNVVRPYVGKLMFNSAVHETMHKEYIEANPLTLTFELPSPWRTDIENAPRNCNRTILLFIRGEAYTGFRNGSLWIAHAMYELVTDEEITAWMEIPALPERI